jgi:hypothetical protein
MHGIIIAHGKAKKIIELHKITWDKYLDSYEIVSPKDDPAVLTNVKTTTCGLSEHNGAHTLERQRFAFELAARHTTAAVIEYDVILLDNLPIPNEMTLLSAKRCKDGQVFVSDWYSHCPWVVTKKTAKTIASYKNKFVDAKYGDRWLAAVCDAAGISQMTLPNSYSPFGGNVYDIREERALQHAVNRCNAHYIHGNKKYDVSKHIIIDRVL